MIYNNNNLCDVMTAGTDAEELTSSMSHINESSMSHHHQ